jgi:hypothetical protein
MDILNKIEERFSEDFKSIISPYNIILVIIVALFINQSILIHETISRNLKKDSTIISERIIDPHSVWIEIGDNNLKQIFSYDTGLLFNIKVWIYPIAIIILFIFKFLYKKFKVYLLKFCLKIYNFEEYVKKLSGIAKSSKTGDQENDSKISSGLEKEIDQYLIFFYSISSLNEIVFGCSILSFLSTLIKQYTDIYFGFLFLIVSLITLLYLLIYYCSKILPHVVYIQVLNNQKVVFGKIIIES